MILKKIETIYKIIKKMNIAYLCSMYTEMQQ